MNRYVLALTACVGILGSNSLMLSPIAGAVALSFRGAAPADVMVASAAYGLGTAFSALTLAPLADRVGAERILVHALCGLIAALLFSALAPSVLLLCLAQALAGLAAGVALPATYGLAAQVAKKGQESATLGIVLTGWTLSMVAGISLSALLAELMHWRGVFVSLALGAFLVAVLVMLQRDWGSRPRTTQKTSPFTALRVAGALPALAVCSAYMVAFYGLYAFLGAHLQGHLGYATTLAGLAPVAYGIGFGVAAPFDRLIDRYGSKRISVFVFGLLALVYGSLAVSAASYLGIVALCFLWGLVNHLGLNLIVGRLNALDSTQRGAIMGLYSAVTYLSMFAGTLVFRPLFSGYGFVACALLSSLCILPALWDAVRQRLQMRYESRTEAA